MNSDESNEFGASVKEDYKKLLNDIEKSKSAALDTYKNELMSNLEDEIIKRFFYREGLYDYYLKNDEAITSATKLLSDNNKYEKILK